MFIRPTATTRRFLDANPKPTRHYEWLPLYDLGGRVLTIIHGKLLDTPFRAIPTHQDFCDWIDEMTQDWFDTVEEPKL